MPAQTHLFPCLKDNYGVLLHDPQSGATAAIDAPEAAPIEAALKSTGWRLTDILVTHHHADHTDGIPALKERHKCRVVAPQAEAARIPLVDETVRENDKVRVGSLEARVIETPGHTLGQVNFFFPADKLLFAGDTLFSIGCGRVIEGNAEAMWQSLLKLRALPDDTAVYCGHEYTKANIRFAAHGRAEQCRARCAREGRGKLIAAGSRPSRQASATRSGQPRSCAPEPEVAMSATFRQPSVEGVRRNPRAQEQVLVPRTRSSHDFSAGTVANFGFKSGTRIIELLVSSRFRSSLRGRCESLRTSESGH